MIDRRKTSDSSSRGTAPMGSLLGMLLLPFALVLLWQVPALAAETATVIPPPTIDESGRPSAGTETAALAGGCFWGVQAVFQHVIGVSQAVSGYSGGSKDTAQYEIVGSGRTGHAESVEIVFDPSVITYGRILQIFFSVAHNPTELNRQGPDVGTQYRSAIFVRDATQRRLAEGYIVQLDEAAVFRSPIATQVSALEAFYPAEAYHQDYATLHPDNPYIAYNDLPKIEDLKRTFPALYRTTPVLVSAGRTSN
jgi:peptide-methionine (S)-S-oxide reductase